MCNINIEENEEYKSICKKIDELYDEIFVLKEKKHEVSNNLINLKGKYLAIKNSIYDDEPSTYAYCYYMWYSSDMSGNKCWILNCVAFSGHITDYLDNSYMRYDQLEQIYLYNTDTSPVQQDIKRFSIISKEEYMSKFNEIIDIVKEEHNKLNFENLLKDDE